MIRHVVALQLAAIDVTDRRRQAEEIKSRLEALADVDDGLLDITVHFDLGLVDSHWPVLLVVDFTDNDALLAYQAHPRHVEVVEWMNTGIVSGRVVVDFEVT
ncbi:MAG TPA: Dabb family protein [Acidimicrobiales bacterium]|nr:Dabb family protein [Acidimicrobiales bacterium]